MRFNEIEYRFFIILFINNSINIVGWFVRPAGFAPITCLAL